MQVRLKDPTGYFTETTPSEAAGADTLDKNVLIVYTGEFDSMDGPVTITTDHLSRIMENHNTKMKRVALEGGGNDYKNCPPIQLDHSTSALMTVGRLVGPINIADVNIDGEMLPGLFGKMRILGKENVEKSSDGRWTHVSMGADLESGELTELTITPFPAAPNASMLKRFKKLGGSMEKEKQEKLKKHLMEKHKLSDKDADDKLSRMSKAELDGVISEIESSEGEAMDQAAAAIKKAQEAHSMEPTVSFQSKQDVIRLAKSFRTTSKVVQLQQRTRQIKARLSKFVSEKKLSPAELKSVELSKLAALNDEAVEFYFASLKNRQPVLDTRVIGTTKAAKLSKVQAELRSRRLELQSRLNMPSKRVEAQAALSRLAEEEKKALSEVGPDSVMSGGMGESPAEHAAGDEVPVHEHMKHMAHFAKMAHACMEAGNIDEAKEHMKSLMHHLSSVGPDATLAGEHEEEEHLSAEDDESTEGEEKKAKMSTSAQNLKRLQSQFEELITLVSPALGIDSKDLV